MNDGIGIAELKHILHRKNVCNIFLKQPCIIGFIKYIRKLCKMLYRCDSYDFFECVLNRIDYENKWRAYFNIVTQPDETGRRALFETEAMYNTKGFIPPNAADYLGKKVLVAYNRKTQRGIVIKRIKNVSDDEFDENDDPLK